MMTDARGASNAKAKRELDWQLRYPSWRLGFTKGLGLTPCQGCRCWRSFGPGRSRWPTGCSAA